MPDPVDDPNFGLPESLERDLRGLGAVPRIPADIDRAILNNARAQFARRSRLRLTLRLGGAAAAAASVALALGIYAWTSADRSAPHPTLAYDVTGDGKVDIVDALRAAHDRKGRAEVDAIAMAAVRVGEVTP